MIRFKQSQEQEESYTQEVENAQADMQEYGTLLADGEISEEEFEDRMRDRIKALFVALALIASGGEFSPDEEDDIDDLEFFLNARYGLLEEFMDDIGEGGLTANYIAWRAGLYAGARHVFIRYTVPRDIFLDMPVLPGVDCLGDGWCQCSLEVEIGEESALVYWYLGVAEHCEVCLSAAAASPYEFPF